MNNYFYALFFGIFGAWLAVAIPFSIIRAKDAGKPWVNELEDLRPKNLDETYGGSPVNKGYLMSDQESAFWIDKLMQTSAILGQPKHSDEDHG